MQNFVKDFAKTAQDAAATAAKHATTAASHAARSAQSIDMHKVQSAATKVGAAAIGLQRHVSAGVGDLIERVGSKETIVVEGTTLLVLKQLAEGGFGFVYRAKHAQTQREYAVKRMITQDRESRELAAAEAALMKAMKHPNILGLVASSEGPRENGGYEFLLVMELATLGTLARWVTPNDDGRMPPPIREEAMLLNFHDACKGVAFMHAMSPPLTHFDLKLENVLEFDSPNGTTVCKLCDFGSASTRTFDPSSADRRAKLNEEDLLSRFSTAMNRSPEMMDVHSGDRGLVGPPSDVWALGCMLFTLAYQRHPFDDGSGNVTPLAVLNGRYYFPNPNRYSPQLGRIIKAALTPRPAERPTVVQLIALVAQAVAETSAAHLSSPVRGAVPMSTRSVGGMAASAPAPPPPPPPPQPPSGPMIGDLLGGDDLIGSSSSGGGAPAASQPAADGWAAFETPPSFTTAADAVPPPRATNAASATADLLGGFGDPPASAVASIDVTDGLFGLDALGQAPTAPPAPQANGSPHVAGGSSSAMTGGGGFDDLMMLGSPAPNPATAAAPAPPPSTLINDPMADWMAGMALGGNGNGASNAAPGSGPAASGGPGAAAFDDLFSQSGASVSSGGASALPVPPSAAAAAAAGSAEPLPIGKLMTIKNLRSKPELNGKSATIVEGLNNGRYRCSIEGDYGEIVLAIKTENLAPRQPRY